MSSPTKLFQTHLNKGFLFEVFELYIDGKAGPGVDGQSTKAFKTNLDWEATTLIRKLKIGTFQFSPYREKLLSKGVNKLPRQISIPTVRDKLVLKLLSLVLAKIFPNHSSIPPHSIIKKVHVASENSPETSVYIRLDIKDFYPSVDHDILSKILAKKCRSKAIVGLINRAIKNPTGANKKSEIINKKGIPQGLSIANILASIYLEDLDDDFGSNPDYSYFRFVDDILIVCSPEKADKIASSISNALLINRKLQIHEIGTAGKSEIVPIIEGVEYLGYKFKRTEISVRNESFKKMFRILIGVFTKLKNSQNKTRVIWSINLKITGCIYNGRRIGWLFYFSQTQNWQQLNQLDAFVLKQSINSKIASPDPRIKTFKKSYREIRFNSATSNYFPNFDQFDDEQMKSELAILKPNFYTNEYLDALTSEELKRQFDKTIAYEIRDLERDMFESFS
ncbi:reverse transcriptase domain-containing protein [Ahrensia kielensis]|uniref:reverse transcriptase domain-containing protein n=1 Tax=Ahrensia kielensis TaxID=76980 RepID=UPI0003A3CEE5|nr:reverse transcriptase domain-containing protein [Ahrensia kielensis]